MLIQGKFKLTKEHKAAIKRLFQDQELMDAFRAFILVREQANFTVFLESMGVGSGQLSDPPFYSTLAVRCAAYQDALTDLLQGIQDIAKEYADGGGK